MVEQAGKISPDHNNNERNNYRNNMYDNNKWQLISATASATNR